MVAGGGKACLHRRAERLGNSARREEVSRLAVCLHQLPAQRERERKRERENSRDPITVRLRAAETADSMEKQRIIRNSF
ncbi:hypothetical protein QQF64_035101 [Cirrhinus molitorella]|uniref:Uncharacterized protein n=1 Tax=Cirrhinus molitorella TaxID=172907 RepID=A0ABR3NET2_9TELE